MSGSSSSDRANDDDGAMDAPTFRCAEPDCTEPDVPAYICSDGCVVGHRELEHWADGSPRQPNHHNNWHPLRLAE